MDPVDPDPEQQPRMTKKRVHAPRAVLWLVPILGMLIMEFVGLFRRDGWGPLSNAVWVVTEDKAGFWWWTLLAALLWLILHFLFPGERVFGWTGLLWLVGLAWVAWASGRYLLHLF